MTGVIGQKEEHEEHITTASNTMAYTWKADFSSNQTLLTNIPQDYINYTYKELKGTVEQKEIIQEITKVLRNSGWVSLLKVFVKKTSFSLGYVSRFPS